jgi:hypothetical protein
LFRTRLLFTSVVVGALVATAGPASAQEGAAEVELMGQPVWHAAGDELNLRLRIRNTSDSELQGFNVVVGSSYRVTTRSGLQTVYDPSAFEPVSSLPLPLSFPNVSLSPGESHRMVIENPVSDLALIAAGEPGVYPLKVTLQDSAGVSMDSIATQILFYPEGLETGLGIVPLVAINAPPARGPAGSYGADDVGLYPLEEALANDGWLATALDAMGTSLDEGLHAGFAPTPRLLEELADVADGYPREEGDAIEEVPADAPIPRRAQEILTSLRSAIGSRFLQPVKVPYSSPDLPTIASLPDAVTRQLAVGAAALAEVLGDDAGRGGRAWAYAPAGRLDADVLEQISGAGVEHTFFTAGSLQEPPNPEAAGCPVAAFSFACPVTVATELGGSLSGYAFDPLIQAHLGGIHRSGAAATALQKFFAETAMIREELPGTPDRVIAAVLPISSRVPARISSKLIRGLALAPWLDTLTPGEGLKTPAEPVDKEISESLPEVPGTPADSYLTATQDAGITVAQFGSIQPPPGLIRRLGRNVLVAQSRALWTDLDRGLEYATASVEKVEEELRKIDVIGPKQITLTSKRGEFQFIVVNNTGYNVTVDIEMNSLDKLDLPNAGLLEVPPGQHQNTIDVITGASGIFRVTVQLKTPDGLEISDVKPITVRSTEFNEIALAVTFGGLAFVVIFYAVRVIRRRRNHRGPRPGTLAA